jgi:hypothetical protein
MLKAAAMSCKGVYEWKDGWITLKLKQNREIRAPILCERLGLVYAKAKRPNSLAIDFQTERRLEEWYFSEYLA